MQRRKLVLVWGFILTYTSIAYSQKISVGVSAGMTINRLKLNRQFGTVAVKSKSGSDFTVDVCYKASKHIIWVGSLGEMQKNYTIFNAFHNITQHVTNQYQYLLIGPKYSIRIFRNMYAFPGVKMYVARWSSSNMKGQVPNIFSITRDNNISNDIINLEQINDNYVFNPVKDRRFELACSGSFDIEQVLYKSWRISLSGSFIQAISSQQKGETIFAAYRLNQTIKLSVGLVVCL